ncbi:6-phosphogluconolactonase [Lapillicoccus sp.]|uniref:6-phosphogluconolactonase n=1 Tax=Lapillicoccus sp. TaxID=1909287 RepID=UPI003265A9F8
MTSVDQLTVTVHSDAQAAGVAAGNEAAALLRLLTAEGEARVVFAAAPSQAVTLAVLAAADGIDWSAVTCFHMDEYRGLPADHPRRFAKWLDDAIFNRVHPVRVERLSPERHGEADRYAALLAEAPIDLVCYGIGENGHLAFNEPGVTRFDDPDDVVEVTLDKSSRSQQVHDGLFTSLDEVPKTALTLTVPRLLRSAAMTGTVIGSHKADAVALLVDGEISERCPSSAVRGHPHSTLHIDANAASRSSLT